MKTVCVAVRQGSSPWVVRGFHVPAYSAPPRIQVARAQFLAREGRGGRRAFSLFPGGRPRYSLRSA